MVQGRVSIQGGLRLAIFGMISAWIMKVNLVFTFRYLFCNLNSTVLKWGENWPCLHSIICVAISLLQFEVECHPGVRDDMVLLIKWFCKDHSLCTVYCHSKKGNFVKEGARSFSLFWSKKELTIWMVILLLMLSLSLSRSGTLLFHKIVCYSTSC
jgi:hypothetical protein